MNQRTYQLIKSLEDQVDQQHDTIKRMEEEFVKMRHRAEAAEQRCGELERERDVIRGSNRTLNTLCLSQTERIAALEQRESVNPLRIPCQVDGQFSLGPPTQPVESPEMAVLRELVDESMIANAREAKRVGYPYVKPAIPVDLIERAFALVPE
jgi:hypothetical protein